MDYDKFQLLHHKIDAEINNVMSRFYIRKGGRKGGNYTPPPIQNGTISNMTRIACALQYFCGASAYDLMANFDISHPEVMKSVWFVVDAINQVDEFRIQYPSDNDTQQRIADEYACLSGIGFPNCAGCVDGLLIWIEKPSEEEAKRAGIGRKKIFAEENINLA